MKLRDLPLNGVVRDRRSGLSFLVAETDSPVYDGTVLVCENIVRCAAFDAAEPETAGHRVWGAVNKYGSNNYALSNIHQWLNSGKTYWYTPSHPTDTPPDGNDHLRYNEQSNLWCNGFVRGLSPEFVAALREQDVPVIRRTAKGKGELTTVRARVFLPSRTEMGFGDEGGMAEGVPLPFFAGRAHLRCRPTEEQMAIFGRSWNPGWDYGMRGQAALDAAQIHDPKYAWWYWTRTPHLNYAYLLRVMCANGGFSYTMAYNDIVGVRPMCVLDPDTELDEQGFVC